MTSMISKLGAFGANLSNIKAPSKLPINKSDHVEFFSKVVSRSSSIETTQKSRVKDLKSNIAKQQEFIESQSLDLRQLDKHRCDLSGEIKGLKDKLKLIDSEILQLNTKNELNKSEVKNKIVKNLNDTIKNINKCVMKYRAEKVNEGLSPFGKLILSDTKLEKPLIKSSDLEIFQKSEIDENDLSKANEVLEEMVKNYFTVKHSLVSENEKVIRTFKDMHADSKNFVKKFLEECLKLIKKDVPNTIDLENKKKCISADIFEKSKLIDSLSSTIKQLENEINPAKNKVRALEDEIRKIERQFELNKEMNPLIEDVNLKNNELKDAIQKAAKILEKLNINYKSLVQMVEKKEQELILRCDKDQNKHILDIFNKAYKQGGKLSKDAINLQQNMSLVGGLRVQQDLKKGFKMYESYKEGFDDISYKYLKEYSDMQTEVLHVKIKIKNLEIAKNQALNVSELVDLSIQSEHKSKDSLSLQLTSIENKLKYIHKYI